MGRVASIVSRGVCGTVEVLTQWDAQHLSTALAGGTEFVPQKNLWVMREDVASGAKRNSLRSFFRRMQRAGRCHDLHYSIFSRTLEPLGLQRPQTHFEFLQRIFQCLRHHKREANAKNPVCKPWYDVRDAIMGELYHGRCGDLARASVRLAFHDAGPFSSALQAKGLPNGAADGSMLTDVNEVKRTENSGLGPIVAALTPLPARFNVGPGDVLHLAGVLGVLACPGGPQIKTLVGRPLPKNLAPDNLLPNPNSPVKVLTDRFADMGFSIREMMALMGAHSTAKQRFVNPSLAGETLDSTPDVWDVRFYSETQQATAAPGTFRLNSDVNFSHNATTQQDYNRFVGKQSDWGREYADAHLKMSLLGINQNGLTDCSEILPLSIDITTLAVSSGSGKQQPTDPSIDPAKLEAAIQQYRSLWL